MSVLIETSLGDITVDLYCDARPRCCTNFLKLCKIKYYNFNLFHSVQENLVAQTGSHSETGKGGESIYKRLYGDQATYFDAELKPRIKHKKAGLISMVNNGHGMHGSQFFFTLADNLDYLDGVHTVFGHISEGMEFIARLNETYCDKDHRPFKDIRIYHTLILDDPFPDPSGLEIPDRSPKPTREILLSGRIGTEEDLEDPADLPEEELEEKEAQANAKILEMVGDIPEADMKPPENVLFVCKLNAVTTSDDLEIIFSRFGEIKSCEVIKDSKTEASLQYAFIEFSTIEECEKAYLKMENVLIDDRRIHVDFSQSVAKEWQRYRQGDPVKLGAAKSEIQGGGVVVKSGNVRRDQGNYDMVFDDNAHDEDKRKKSKKEDRDRNSQDYRHYKERRRSKERDSKYSRHKRDDYLKSKRRSRSRDRNRDCHSKRHRSRSR